MIWKRFPIDLQTGLLLILAIAFLINSMALFHKEHNPLVVVYNPTTNLAKVLEANRGEEAVRSLMLGGFRDAVAMATGSHPYEVDTDRPLKPGILEQMFSPEAAAYIAQKRQLISPDKKMDLGFNVQLSDIKIKPAKGGLFFDGTFNQTIGEDMDQRVRTFQVKAFGNVAPVTVDNPYQIKFADLKIQEIKFQKMR